MIMLIPKYYSLFIQLPRLFYSVFSYIAVRFPIYL
jgi:hypothetical protein